MFKILKTDYLFSKKVTYEFLLQENIKELAQLNTLYLEKIMISSTSKDTWKYAYLSVWLLLINVKTAEPIGPKFLCAGSHDPREGLWMSQTLYKQNFKSHGFQIFLTKVEIEKSEAQLGGGATGPLASPSNWEGERAPLPCSWKERLANNHRSQK